MTRGIFLPTALAMGLALLPLPKTAAAGDVSPKSWHQPETDAEKALAKVLRLSEKDQNLLEFVLRTPFYKAKAGKGYARFFTRRLLSDMAAMERATVRENCRGKYLPGELCGTDHNPLTCAQDAMEGYLFMTQSQDATHAAIAYRWPTETKTAARYDLVHEDGVWKLDRVRCGP
ncbi:DUF3828 domain-containing protein [Solidesulfovibrio sp.]|uniref:DUF3828 domain-containing protein n=1 Tax=Solidesulfovibrio sp. TaxID=2910990 RepID=UPI00260A7263|nr:DUF3828 domain-containing protein [Solidesulfovibrio sp.]